MRTADEIQALYTQRRNDRGPVINRMHDLRDAYNGDIAIPLPEMSKEEKSSVANLIAQGLDQNAMRVSSVMPNAFYPPSSSTSKRAQKDARTKRDVTLAWWHDNRMKLKLRRRARWLLGYSCSPVVVLPDFQSRRPKWSVRDPLATYPAPCLDPDELTPVDCIFAYKRGMSWIRQNYPEQAAQLNAWAGGNMRRDHNVELLEYIDGDERVLVAQGSAADAAFWVPGNTIINRAIELQRVENRIGMCFAIVPGRITLDRDQGQYDGMIGMFQMQAKLMALQYLATVKGVFADTYLVSRANEQATFVAGPFDGRTGKVNIVKGGDIKDVRPPPDFQTSQLSDRIERAMRLTGGIPAEYGGESTTNVRTGRRGDAILSATVDFPIQEAQEIFQASLMEENRRAIAIDKAYFKRPKTFHIQWKGAKDSEITYSAEKLWNTDVNFVTYAHAGADVNGLIVGLGQRVGIGLMSKHTGREMDPSIEDPELEHDLIIKEGLEQALLSQIQTLASQPEGMPITDLAKIMDLVGTDRAELAEAVMKVQEMAQERQATMDAEGNPTAVDPNAPAAQPGMEVPGGGVEAGTIPEPGEGQKNLAMLLNQMRGARQEIAVNA